ncbi:hypothetical protein BDY19DRAFT_930368 [Irpex rosettiformis]|uniref:Uncharacterized protein n=1 Tax=Irpex rosettiformis TaxID=378272 RepID=A0ACB8UAZ1_9APHY|nr:hypothetical protein BDY19DRAFT_930368 [Irpex rosettiformis]
MARRATSPGPNSLPKVSFTKVTDEYSSQPAGVADLQARSYGYNDGSNFRKPEYYIRYIEPLESDLAQQVEYDMDDQDREWLESVNADRRKEQLDKVSYEVFEIVMDKLEKEWFDLTKTIPKPDLAMPSEDSTCAICDDSEGENTNAIVFCDGCNLAVHQDCYGVPYIPEGQWLCRKCTVSPENPVSCILCPNEGGAFKQTVQGEWVHLLCAIWVPETRVANDVFMEPITGVDKISKPRWRLKCSLCDIRMGACIQCIKSSCTLAFHATCARKEKLLMPMKATQGSEAPVLACYCEKHLPREQAEARAVALALEMADGAGESDNQKSSKTARAYAKTYKLGPPLVPKIIVDRIMQYIGKVTLRQKREFVVLVCKYWSLKREARRGAPLLKRLHLEPWTASNSGRNQSEEDKVIKLEFLRKLKADLDKVRELAELTKKREVQKILQARAVYNLLNRTLLPFQTALRNAFSKIVSFDRLDFFKSPVSRIDVPDYYDIIKRPICWDVIERKLNDYEYLDLDDFKEDVHLVLSNAILYNAPDTPYSKVAQKLKSHADKILVELEQIKVAHSVLPDPAVDSSEPVASSSRLTIGDLEPPLEALQPFIQHATIAEGTDASLEVDPVTSLFKYEFAKEKPPPTPLPKPKRDRRAERERSRQERFSTGGNRARTRSSAGDPTDGGFNSTERMDVDHLDGQLHEDRHDDRKRKRPKIVLPGQSDVPPVVDEVDGREMFTKFDVGWILPDNSRRGGRAPVDRQPIELRRKKPKAERERSHLSTESTVVAPEDIVQPGGRSGEIAASIDNGLILVPASEEAEAMHVDNILHLSQASSIQSEPPVLPTASEEALASASPQSQVLAPMTDTLREQESLPAAGELEATNYPAPLDLVPADVEVTVEPPHDSQELIEEEAAHEEEEEASKSPRVIVIDVLDTPATRREKNMRRKAERLRSLHIAPPADESAGRLVGNQSTVDPDMDVHSELTALTSDEEDGGPIPQNVVSPKLRVQDLGKIVLEKNQRLPHNTPVWAKALTFPWWPAVVVDPDSEDGKDAPEHTDPDQVEKENLHLVRYFDGKRGKIDDSWGWVAVKDLRLFGKFEELDDDMTAKKSKMQRWKNDKMKLLIRRAYQRAKEETAVNSQVPQFTSG